MRIVIIQLSRSRDRSITRGPAVVFGLSPHQANHGFGPGSAGSFFVRNLTLAAIQYDWHSISRPLLTQNIGRLQLPGSPRGTVGVAGMDQT